MFDPTQETWAFEECEDGALLVIQGRDCDLPERFNEGMWLHGLRCLLGESVAQPYSTAQVVVLWGVNEDQLPGNIRRTVTDPADIGMTLADEMLERRPGRYHVEVPR